MKRSLKVLFRRTAKSLGALLLAVLVLAAGFVWRPEWVLTPPTLTKLVQRLGKTYHLEWRSFRLAIRSRSFLDKEVTLRTEDFCARDSTGTFDACFAVVDTALTVRLGRRVTLTELDHLDVDARKLRLDKTKAPPKTRRAKKKPPTQRLAELIPASLRSMKLRSIEVSLPDLLVIQSATQTLSGRAAVSFSTAQAPPLLLTAVLKSKTPAKTQNMQARVSVDSDLFSEGTLTFLRAVGRLKGDAGLAAAFDAKVSQRSDSELDVSADARGTMATRRLRAKLRGTLREKSLVARLTTRVDDSSGTLRSVALDACDADAGLDEDRKPRSLKLACRVVVEPQPFRASPDKSAEKIAALVDFDGKMSPRPLAPDRFQADLSVRMVPLKRWFEFSGRFSTKLAGRLSKLPQSLESQHTLHAGLDVAKFEDLVAYLKDTNFAIPAPIHVMRGPVQVALDSAGDTRKPDQRFTYTATTDLTSGRQKMLVTVEGKVLARKLFTPGRSFENETQVALKKIALELPYLKLGGLPAVKVDSRIRTGEEDPKLLAKLEAERQALESGAAVRKSTPTNVRYRVRVATVEPIILYTNLNAAPIPLAVDLVAANEGVDGRVEVLSFGAELFKRKAQIDHVRLTMHPGSKAPLLDGLLRFNLPDADVRVKLLGSTSKPTAVFESDPPMSQQDIVAMLLFGKAPDDLDPDQKTTASNSQSAMASGAFGLASLYLFASTPIQYVGYDPATQSYAMKFKLPGGATLEVGSKGQQSNHLTLRKRLARQWVLETEAASSRTGAGAAGRRNAVTSFIEWFQRY